MKIRAILISFVLIVSLLPLSAFADQNAHSVNHDFLVSLGICESGDALSNADSIVTRAEFIRYAVKATAMPAESLASDSDVLPFADVSSSHEDFLYISTAVKLGIISGANGFFLPDSPISMQAAAKIAIHVLDYQIMAEAYGGYPTGYMKYANDFDLFDGCEIKSEASLTSSDVAKLLVNTLNANVLETTAVGNDGNKYGSMENLFSRRHKIYKSEGIVTANTYSSILTSDGIGDADLISIGSQNYKTGTAQNTHKYLGYSVEAYYRETNSATPVLVHIMPKAEDNNVTTIKGEDITNVSPSALTYYENDTEETISISADVSIVKNGTLASVTKTNIKETVIPKNGVVTLIDNNSNRQVDVIIVEDYRTVSVRGLSAKTHSVSDGLGGASLELDPSGNNYHVFIEKNGKPATFDDISVGNIISYYESTGSEPIMKKVVISNQSVKGTIEEISSQADMIKIGGSFYKISDNVKSQISISSSGTFYIDHFGRIVDFTALEKDIVYGYITGIKKGSFDSYMVKIFTQNNRWVELPLASRLRHNDDVITASKLYDELGGENLKKQLVTYLVSEDRKVMRLDTAQKFERGSEDEKNAVRQQIFRLSDTYTQTNYHSDGPSFSDYCYLSDTIIFSIPKDSSENYEYSDDKFDIITYSDLINSGVYKNVQVYDMDEFGNAKACIVEYSEKTVNNNKATQPLMIVDSVVDSLNFEGIPVKAVRGFYSGMEAKIIQAEGSTAIEDAKLGKGDVIQVSLDSNGYLNAITKHLDGETDKDKKVRTGGAYAIFTFIAGNVTAVDEEKGLIVIDFGDGDGRTSTSRLTSLKSVYIYNRSADSMTTGGISDISIGDYVYMTSRYLRANSIIVVRDK